MTNMFARTARLIRGVMALALVLPTPALAEDMLTLDDAIALATGAQPALTAFERTAEASEAAAEAARQLPDPNLSVGLQDLPVTGDKAFSLTEDDFTMVTVAVSREQVRRSKRTAAAERYRAEAGVSRAQAEELDLRIEREVTLAWIGAVEANAKQQLLDRLIADLRAGHKVMEAVIPTGQAAPSDYLQTEAEIALAQVQQAEAAGNEAQARAKLRRWIGNAAEQPLPAAVPPLPLPKAASHVPALDHHPSLRVAEAQETVAERQTDVARADRKPDISWSVRYGLRPDYGDLVAAQVTIPLRTNTRRLQNRRIDEASAQAAAARERAEDTRRELRSDYAAALAAYRTAEAQIALLSGQALPALDASVRVAEASYGAGAGTVETPLIRLRQRIEASVKLIESQADRARAVAELVYLTQGRLQ